MEKQEGKKLTKKGGTKKREAASPYGLPKPLQGEGMFLAGYGMLCVGEIKEEDLKLKIHGLILKGLNFRGLKYALSHTDHLSLNS